MSKSETTSNVQLSVADIRIIVNALSTQSSVVQRRINAESNDAIKALLEADKSAILILQSSLSNMELPLS